mgnify:CR=1 FL=1
MVAWITSKTPVPYDDAMAWMETRAEAIRAGTAQEAVWLLEHPPMYTAGTSANLTDLKDAARFPVYAARRGGQYTYHGPGQRIVYIMLDLTRRGRDVRHFVAQLEAWVIAALGDFNVKGELRQGRVGVWVRRPDKPPLPDGDIREDKIAAIGVRLRKWVTTHGLSINVDPDLSHYDGIVPCGISDRGVTSLIDLGLPITMEDVDTALHRQFENVFS